MSLTVRKGQIIFFCTADKQRKHLLYILSWHHSLHYNLKSSCKAVVVFAITPPPNTSTQIVKNIFVIKVGFYSHQVHTFAEANSTYQPTCCSTCCRSRSRSDCVSQTKPKNNTQNCNKDEGSSKRDQDTECHDGVLTKSGR